MKRAHTHTHSLSLFLTHTLSHTQTHTLFSHTHTHIHTYAHTLSLSLSLSLFSPSIFRVSISHLFQPLFNVCQAWFWFYYRINYFPEIEYETDLKVTVIIYYVLIKFKKKKISLFYKCCILTLLKH